MKGWVLITGASSGIGYELAGVFAARRHNLILVARREARLREIAGKLQAQYGIEVRVLAKDLSSAPAAREIFEELRTTPVSILVNNAGFGWYGAFAEEEPQGALDIMHVNMDALVELTRRFLPPMIERKEGRILNVASTAAFQPGPFCAIYFASKAFVVSFSCALAEELSATEITVTALCPGGTHSQFHERAGGQRRIFDRFPMMSARDVAEAGYEGLMAGRRIVVAGMLNRITTIFSKWLPSRLVTKLARRFNET